MDEKDLKDLRDKRHAAYRLHHEAEAAQQEFLMAVSMARARLLVPPGHDIDILGDGAVKPAKECRPF